MFENFVFGTQQAVNAGSREDISASPMDCSFPPPQLFSRDCLTKPKPGAINEIVQQLTQHSLQPEEHELPRISVWRQDPLIPDVEEDASLEFTEEEEEEEDEEDLSYVSTLRATATVPFPSHHSTQSLPNTPSMPRPRGRTVACRRLQRQLNVQLQSCNNHMKDISALVEDMVATNSQCTIHQSASRPNLPSPPISKEEDEANDFILADPADQMVVSYEDEGFVDMEEDEISLLEDEMTLRRASAPWGVRKNNLVRWKKSADCVTNVNALGLPKKRCVPRMRKRPKVLPE